MIIRGAKGESIENSRGDKTIRIILFTDVGPFSASAPEGKSKGKFEIKPYKKSLEEDIKKISQISDYFLNEHIENFSDLRLIEDILKGQVGGNTLIAFEFAALKAIATEKKIEVWELINPKSKKIPRLVGNCIGGGLHSKLTDGKKPDIQEFLLIPNEKTALNNFKKNLEDKKEIGHLLKKKDSKFCGELNDENAWQTALNDKDILEILGKKEFIFGVDVASSGFYKRKKYHYKNPLLDRNIDEQFSYMLHLIENFGLIYCEDPFSEEDFQSHSNLLKIVGKKCMIVGDDLTVTNYKRLKKAIEMKSINAIIIKPNQCGSLIEVFEVVKLAKDFGIKLIFSHRSGETMESILADLAVGFEADFIKCGITGDVREIKIKRLIEIEKQINLKNAVRD